MSNSEYIKNKYSKQYSYLTNRFWELVAQWEKTYPGVEMVVNVTATKLDKNNKPRMIGVRQLKKMREVRNKKAEKGPLDPELIKILEENRVKYLEKNTQTDFCEDLENEINRIRTDFEVNMTIIKQEMAIEKDNIIQEFNRIANSKKTFKSNSSQTENTKEIGLEIVTNNNNDDIAQNTRKINTKSEKTHNIKKHTEEKTTQSDLNENLSSDPLLTSYISVVKEDNKQAFVDILLKVRHKEIESSRIDEDGVELLKLIQSLAAVFDSSSAKLLVKSYLETVNKLLFLAKVSMQKCDKMIILLEQFRSRN